MDFVSGPTHLVNQPEARESKPITFSIIVNDGPKSDLKLTIKSILLCSEIFTEIVLPRDAKNYSDLIDTTSPGAKFCQFIYADGAQDKNFIHRATSVSNYDFVLVLGAGDTIKFDALWKLSKFINKTRCDLVYTDEEQTARGNLGSSADLKPSWSPELLTSFNYFGRLTAIRRDVVLKALSSCRGGFFELSPRGGGMGSQSSCQRAYAGDRTISGGSVPSYPREGSRSASAGCVDRRSRRGLEGLLAASRT